MPDKNALVGVQKIAAANSNVATRHILNSGLFLTAEVAEQLSLRISDILEYSPTADAFIQAIGAHNVATLKELTELHLYDFGIFIELAPDEEEKALLENNIQVALSQQTIDLEDIIDIREVRNIKLANQLLKIRRKKKIDRDQKLKERNIQVQAQANAQAEVQKQQAITQQKISLAQAQSQIEIAQMQAESEIKLGLMQQEFQFNMELKGVDVNNQKSRDREKEDRKDERTRIQATQQSKMIEQRKNDQPAKNFESMGNDILGGGFDLSQFEPR
jgi:hypothetical protein